VKAQGQVCWTHLAVGLASVLLCFLLSNGESRAAEKVLRLGLSFIAPGKGNPYQGISMPTIVPHHAVFDTLTYVDEHGKIAPGLAVSWHSNDAMTWTFKLRRGVSFSNGEPFDTEALRVSVEHMRSAIGEMETVGSNLYHVQEARPINEHTVEVVLSERDALFPLHATLWRIPAPKLWKELGPEEFAKVPAGTGPYQVTAWEERGVFLQPFPGSWRAGKLDRVELLKIPEQTARLQALLSGAVNLVMGLSPEDKDALESVGASLYSRVIPATPFIAFLTTKDIPVKDTRVRQALNYAVNRELIIERLLGASTHPLGQLAYPGAFGFDPDLESYPYDPDKAKALLARAGYPEGFDMVITLSGRGANETLYYQQIAEDLRDVGVKVELRLTTAGNMTRNLFDGTFQGDAFALGVRGFDPLNAYRHRVCLGILAERSPYHCDASLLPLLREARSQTSELEAERIYREVLRLEFDSPPGIFLWQWPEFDGVSAGVEGYAPLQDVVNFNDIWIAD